MKRHHTDVTSLVFGLVFACLAGWALIGTLDLSGAALRWGGAALLVVVGLVLVITARSKDDESRDIS